MPNPSKKIILYFPSEFVERPLTNEIIQKFGLIVNIFSASISSDERGFLGIELSGNADKISEAVDFIKSQGIEVKPLGSRISRDEKKCVNCGVCISICPVNAIYQKDFEIFFDSEKCIACGSCIESCPFKAIFSGE